MNKTYVKKPLAVAVILLFFSVSVIPSTGTTDVKQVTMLTTSGDILYVGGSGPGNYSKIQDAINDSDNGDTIFVYNGTYYENIEVYNSIDLVGEDRDNTFIVGFKEKKNTVRIFRNNTNISGFTIYNSNRSAICIASYNHYTNVYNYSIFDNDISFNRHGISTFNSHNIMIYDNIIENNTYHGIYIQGTNDVRISTNIVSNNDIGIRIDNWYNEAVTNYIIEDNVITNNIRWGVNVHYCKGLLLVNNSISNNNDTGIIIYNSNYAIISNNSINNNQHQGIFISDSSNLTISWNNISNNWTGIWVGYGEYHSIMHNLIQYNEVGVNLVLQDNGNFNNNTIIKNREEGIDITNSYYNNINHNNFMYNGRQASFFFSKGSNWNGNYWNRPRNLPKLIFGYGLELMILGKNIYITIPWINFDWHPAQEPYDIGV